MGHPGVKYLKTGPCGRPDSRISNLLEGCHLLHVVWWSLSLVMVRVETGGQEFPGLLKIQMLYSLGLLGCHRAGTDLWDWARRQRVVTLEASCWFCHLVSRESSALRILLSCITFECAVTVFR